jgi:lipoprotein-releasing system permease protein
MKSLGMREYAVRRIFIIEAAMIGVVGILFDGFGLSALLRLVEITIFNPLTGTTVPLQIYYSATHYVIAGAIRCQLRRRGYSGAQGDAGTSG